MNYSKLSQKPSHFKRYTGLNIVEFEKLVEDLRPSWEKAELKRLSRSNRQRKIGAGRKSKLPTFEDKLFLVLVFYKLYLPFDLLGYLFNLDKSNISRQIKVVEPILAKKIKLPKIEREKAKRISTLDELFRVYPEMREYITDATEQEIPRPKDKAKRKKYYSGKKKRHTIKTQLVTERNSGFVLEVSDSVAGSIHDYKLFKRSGLGKRLPQDIPKYFDRGYEGVKRDYPHLNNLFLPQKANRWHKLTKADKIYNKKLNKIRVKVEHAINK